MKQIIETMEDVSEAIQSSIVEINSCLTLDGTAHFCKEDLEIQQQKAGDMLERVEKALERLKQAQVYSGYVAVNKNDQVFTWINTSFDHHSSDRSNYRLLSFRKPVSNREDGPMTKPISIFVMEDES